MLHIHELSKRLEKFVTITLIERLLLTIFCMTTMFLNLFREDVLSCFVFI